MVKDGLSAKTEKKQKISYISKYLILNLLANSSETYFVTKLAQSLEGILAFFRNSLNDHHQENNPDH